MITAATGYTQVGTMQATSRRASTSTSTRHLVPAMLTLPAVAWKRRPKLGRAAESAIEEYREIKKDPSLSWALRNDDDFMRDMAKIFVAQAALAFVFTSSIYPLSTDIEAFHVKNFIADADFALGVGSIAVFVALIHVTGRVLKVDKLLKRNVTVEPVDEATSVMVRVQRKTASERRREQLMASTVTTPALTRLVAALGASALSCLVCLTAGSVSNAESIPAKEVAVQTYAELDKLITRTGMGSVRIDQGLSAKPSSSK